MQILKEDSFDWFDNDEKSQVFQIFPKVFSDKRGYFVEVLKDIGEWPKNDIPLWFSNTEWIRQINRSGSSKNVIRGCHAQRGVFCQGKLVEAVNDRIYDLITDARPNSKTFGGSNIFILDPDVKNQLWVPRGFLHCVIYPNVEKQALLQYFCDNTYNHENEFSINPKTLVPDVVDVLKKMSENDEKMTNAYAPLFEMFEKNEQIYSEKDENGLDYKTFMNDVKKEYEENGKLWFK